MFLDLAKAFDIVSHNSIEKGLNREGMPDQVRGTIMEMYQNATTRISVGGKTTRDIKINAGVKQGCPLSPLFSNLIIDELLEKVHKLNVGINISNKLLCCMAFADDLALITEERIHKEILLENCRVL